MGKSKFKSKSERDSFGGRPPPSILLNGRGGNQDSYLEVKNLEGNLPANRWDPPNLPVSRGMKKWAEGLNITETVQLSSSAG